MECRFGQTEQNTKESGKTIKRVGRESLSTQMEMNTKENGWMIKPTARGRTFIKTGQNTQGIGLTMRNSVLVLKFGRMGACSKECMRTE